MENGNFFKESEFSENLYLYHATDARNLESIRRGGLLCKPPHRNWDDMTDNLWGDFVFLAVDPNIAESYAETQPDAPDEVVTLKIKVSDLDENRFGYDWNNTCEYSNEVNTMTYAGDIPAEVIEVCDGSEPFQDMEDFKGHGLYEKVMRVFWTEVESNREIDDIYGYQGVFLDEESCEMLRGMLPNLGRYVSDMRVTFDYGLIDPFPDDVEGELLSLKVRGYAENENCSAVSVILPEKITGCYRKNNTPCVMVSMAKDCESFNLHKTDFKYFGDVVLKGRAGYVLFDNPDHVYYRYDDAVEFNRLSQKLLWLKSGNSEKEANEAAEAACEPEIE